MSSAISDAFKWVLPGIIGNTYCDSELRTIEGTLPIHRMPNHSFAKCAEIILGGREDCEILLPQTYEVDATMLASVKKTVDAAPRLLNIPLILMGGWSEHLVLIIVEKNERRKIETIEFFDSKGCCIADYPEVKAIVDEIQIPDCRIVDNAKRLQSIFDGMQCGGFVLHRIQQRLTKKDEDPTSWDIVKFRLQLANQLGELLALPPTPIEENWEVVREFQSEGPFWIPPAQAFTTAKRI